MGFKGLDPNGLFIIAEAGVNHNGDVKLALEMAEAAKASGADAVKYQTWITEQVYTREDSIKPEYQLAGTDPEESEFDTVKRNELSFDAFRKIKRHCDKIGIMMLSTPDEWRSADFLIDDLGLPVIKIASQDVNNFPFLRYLGRRKKPLIYSTGASDLAEVKAGVRAILSAGCPSLTVLHCTSCYPAAAESVNLKAIETLRRALSLPVGYSDHTTGIAVGVAAVALGACVLEKHFTLSRKLPGPDQQASLEPDELRDYVRAARDVKAALGDGRKVVQPQEKANRVAMRRYMAASRDLPVGHVIREKDVAFMKISSGLEPKSFDRIIGARLRSPMKLGQRFAPEDLERPRKTTSARGSR